VLSLLLLVLGVAVGIPVIDEFIMTRYITKVPSAILVVGMVVLSTLAMVCGLILDTIVKQHRKSYEILLTLLKKSL
jgi:hypothetical protein